MCFWSDVFVNIVGIVGFGLFVGVMVCLFFCFI